MNNKVRAVIKHDAGLRVLFEPTGVDETERRNVNYSRRLSTWALRIAQWSDATIMGRRATGTRRWQRLPLGKARRRLLWSDIAVICRRDGRHDVAVKLLLEKADVDSKHSSGRMPRRRGIGRW
jgi:hypothetical protein